jgi:hypothetical protein
MVVFSGGLVGHLVCDCHAAGRGPPQPEPRAIDWIARGPERGGSQRRRR